MKIIKLVRCRHPIGCRLQIYLCSKCDGNCNGNSIHLLMWKHCITNCLWPFKQKFEFCPTVLVFGKARMNEQLSKHIRKFHHTANMSLNSFVPYLQNLICCPIKNCMFDINCE